MADKQTLALKRLLKKLSALRVTLRRDERDLLDQLVLGASADVAGHAMVGAASTQAAAAKMARAASTEVAAHQLAKAAATKAAAAKMARAASTEVAAHAMSTEAAARGVVSGAQLASSIRAAIAFDAARAIYLLRE